MALHDYYFHDPRVVLVPVEHLGPDGISAEFRALATERSDLGPEQLDVLSQGFSLYWQRGEDMASRTETWPQPRYRHIAVVVDEDSVHPYTSILASAWTLFSCDLDPESSNPDFVAAALVVADFMMYLGEVARAPIYAAAWWLARTEDEIAAFADAAQRSRRPDAAAWKSLGEATSWLLQLHHETLRPPVIAAPGEPLPGTGILVPKHLGHPLVELGEAFRNAAVKTMAGFKARFGDSDFAATSSLCKWLTETAPPLLVTVEDGRILWSADASQAVGKLRGELKRRSGAAVRDIAEDLQLVASYTARFRGAIDVEALPPPDEDIESGGYTYLHRDREAIAYNLDERTVDRRQGPALPYARAMLGARTIHEWGHLAADAGWVPQRGADLAQRNAAFAAELDAAIQNAPEIVQQITTPNLQALATPAPDSPEAKLPEVEGAPATPGGGLVRLFYSRMTDFQSNLVGAKFLAPFELETYVRQNIRPLRMEYESHAFWRMLVRHLYEYQYLRFSQIPDPRAYFFKVTACDRDFFHTEILDEERFDRLLDGATKICDAYAVDEERIRVG